MKKILIVGRNGYVSKAFQQYLKNDVNYQIFIISSRNHEWENYSFSGYDTVFNASGLSHANARKGTEEQYYEINGRLPIELAEKAKNDGVPHFINISSSIVYGDFSQIYQQKKVKINTIPLKTTVYGKSKMMAEEGLGDLASEDFKIAILRPPLIYGPEQTDNFERLVKFAMKAPVFPNVYNEQSMIYIDNFCELLRLIIDNKADGLFFPQEKEYIHTSKMVKDIAVISGNSLFLTKLFNPLLWMLRNRLGFIHKALGSCVYDKTMSNHFNWSYCVVSYEDGLKTIVNYKKSLGSKHK